MAVPTFILYIATSLDGYIARPDGRIDWLPPVDPDAEDFGYTKFFTSIDALVMGSITYEQVLSFGAWAYAGKQTYVLTRRSLCSPRLDIAMVQTGVDGVIEQISQQGHQRVWVVGGGKLASAFMQRQLIDEFRITIVPTLLGSGVGLYQSIPEHTLRLTQVTPFTNGAVELQYFKA